MTQSRRSFLGAAATFAAVSAWGAASLAAQAQGQTGTPELPLDPLSPSRMAGPMPGVRLSPADRMKMNQAQIKKNMARLTEVVGELKKDLDANSTTTVLSMATVHKTEEIEKLARDIRALIRG